MEEIHKTLLALGFNIQVSSWDREDLSRMTVPFVPLPLFDNAIQYEFVVGEQDVWQVIVGKKVEIIHATKGNLSFGFIDVSQPSKNLADTFKPLMSLDRLFYGTLLNGSDLITLLEWVGCPLNLIPNEQKALLDKAFMDSVLYGESSVYINICPKCNIVPAKRGGCINHDDCPYKNKN